MQRHAGSFKTVCCFSASSVIFWCSETVPADTCALQWDLCYWDHDHCSPVLVSTQVGKLAPEGAASWSGWRDPRATPAPLVAWARHIQPSSHDLQWFNETFPKPKVQFVLDGAKFYAWHGTWPPVAFQFPCPDNLSSSQLTASHHQHSAQTSGLHFLDMEQVAWTTRPPGPYTAV